MQQIKVVLFIFCFVLQAQESNILETEGISLSSFSAKNLAPYQLQSNFSLTSIADFPIRTIEDLRFLKFLQKLEQYWEKMKREKDFWQKYAQKIQQQAKGVKVAPVAFDISTGKPLYQVTFSKQHDKKEKDQVIQCHWSLVQIDEFLYSFQAEYQKAIQFHTAGKSAFKRAAIEESLSNANQAIKILKQLNSPSKLYFHAQDLKGMLCYEQGKQNFRKGKYEKAKGYYRQSLKIYREFDSSEQIFFNLNGLGSTFLFQKKYSQSFHYYNEALQLSQQLQNKAQEATALFYLGELSYHWQKYQAGLEYFSRALLYYQESRQAQKITNTLSQIGRIYQTQQNYDGAIQAYQKSLKWLPKNSQEEAQFLNKLGLLHLEIEEFEQATQYFKESYNFYKNYPDSFPFAIINNNLGWAYYNTESYQLAQLHLNEALKAHQNQKRSVESADTLTNLGLLSTKMERYKEGFNYLKQALNLRQQQNQRRQEGILYNHLGTIHLKQLELKEAFLSFERYEKISKQENSLSDQARALVQQGKTLTKQNQLIEALDKLEQSEGLYEKEKDFFGVAQTLKLKAQVYKLQRKDSKALQTYQESIRLQKELQPWSSSLADTLHDLTTFYLSKGNREAASSTLKQALEIYLKRNIPSGIASIYLQQAEIYQQEKEYQQSQQKIQLALEVFQKIPQQQEVLKTLNKLAENQILQKKFPQALFFSQQVLEQSTTENFPLERAKAFEIRGVIDSRQQRYQAAIEQFQKALQLYQRYHIKEGEGDCWYFLGVTAEYLNHDQKALVCFLKALPFFENLQPSLKRIKILKSIGTLFRKQRKFKEATDYLKQAIVLLEQNSLSAEHSEALIFLGQAEFDQENFENALQYFQQARKKADSTSYLAAVALFNQGQIYLAKQAYQKGLLVLQEALKEFQQQNDIEKVCETLNVMGDIYFSQREYSKANTFYQKTLQNPNRSPKVEIVALKGCGECCKNLNNATKAIQYYQKASQLAQTNKELDLYGQIQIKFGQLFEFKKENEKALSYYFKAQKLFEKQQNFPEVALALNHQAKIYLALNKKKRAQQSARQALQLSKQYYFRKEKIYALIYLGRVENLSGNFQQSISYLNQALELLRKDILINETKILLHLGEVYQQQGKHKETLEVLQLALAQSKRQKNQRLASLYLNNIGLTYDKIGRWQKALTSFREALSLANEKEAKAGILNNIGGVYQKLGEPKKALNYFQNSHKIYLLCEDHLRIAISLNNIASSLNALGQKKEAKEFYQQTLQIYKTIKYPLKKATTLNNLATIYFKQYQYSTAEKLYQECIQIYQSQGLEILTVLPLNNLGVLYNEQNKHSLALTCYQRALQLSQQKNNYPELAEVHLNLGKYYELLKQKEEAKKHYLASIQYFNIISSQAGSGRESLLKELLPTLYSMIEFFIRVDEKEEAFTLLQQCKAYGFLSKFSERSLPLEKYANPELIKQKHEIHHQIVALQKQIFEQSSLKEKNWDLLTKLKRERTQKEEKLAQLQEQIRFGNPAFAEIKFPKPVGLEELQQELKPNELFLEFLTIPPEQESNAIEEHFYCFVIGKNFLKIIKAGQTKNITKQINTFRQLLWESQHGSETLLEYYELAQKLYQQLLHPALSLFPEGKIDTLFLAPDSCLHLLPFEALCINSKIHPKSFQELTFVLDQYQISYTISATVLLRGKQQTRRKGPLKLFGIGAPYATKETYQKTEKRISPWAVLPGAKTELEMIGSLFPPENRKILLGKAANEPQLFLDKKIKQYQILHFATHGLIDAENPLRSALLLAQLSPQEKKQWKTLLKEASLNSEQYNDGLLQVRDIFSLYQKINPELVLLSACETGAGTVKNGDGIIGLSRAWQFAGTPSIIVTLWPIDDQATIQLIQHFYIELLKTQPESLNGLILPALQKAKKHLRNSNSSPYQWASFILRGHH